MIPFTTPKVYIVEGCDSDPQSAARLKRMLASIKANSVQHVTLGELDQIAADGSGQFGCANDPHIIFTRFAWHTPNEEQAIQERYPHLTHNLRSIWGANQFRVVGGFDNAWDGAICRPLWNSTPLQGCRHACTYCSCIYPGFVSFSINLEEFMTHHDKMIQCAPWQPNWHTGGVTDLSTFEPEYGYTAMLLENVARHDRYALFYTSTDQVDFLMDMPHRDRAIIQWTISPEVLTRFETRAPSLQKRIAAMKRCQDAGCTVRCQFSPLVPLEGWRESYAAMIEEVFATVEPDLISSHMIRCPQPYAQSLQKWFGADALDSEYEAMLIEADQEGKQSGFPGNHIFPYDARAALYQHILTELRRASPEVPFALCRETPEMWEHFGSALGVGPDLCGCGSTPRNIARA